MGNLEASRDKRTVALGESGRVSHGLERHGVERGQYLTGEVVWVALFRGLLLHLATVPHCNCGVVFGYLTTASLGSPAAVGGIGSGLPLFGERCRTCRRKRA